MTYHQAAINGTSQFSEPFGLPVIRDATIEDAEQIAMLGSRFHNQASWSDIFSYSIGDCVASLENFIGKPNFICMVADEGGKFVSFGSLVLAPVYFNHKHISAEELFWWSDPESSHIGIGRKLKKALDQEALNRGASSIQMKSIDLLNGDRMAKLYARDGYRPSERSFIKRLV
ncbi:MAG: GNAT family N-acetyltransferase [Actinobacteria bacterium]|nr:GNAT family N-acetyltransferase [Actinomycetota bacterium]